MQSCNLKSCTLPCSRVISNACLFAYHSNKCWKQQIDWNLPYKTNIHHKCWTYEYCLIDSICLFSGSGGRDRERSRIQTWACSWLEYPKGKCFVSFLTVTPVHFWYCKIITNAFKSIQDSNKYSHICTATIIAALSTTAKRQNMPWCPKKSGWRKCGIGTGLVRWEPGPGCPDEQGLATSLSRPIEDTNNEKQKEICLIWPHWGSNKEIQWPSLHFGVLVLGLDLNSKWRMCITKQYQLRHGPSHTCHPYPILCYKLQTRSTFAQYQSTSHFLPVQEYSVPGWFSSLVTKRRDTDVSLDCLYSWQNNDSI